MKNLPVELLHTFAEFVDAGSLANAAKNLRITQPAVSQQLRRLDESTPFPLFAMVGKRKVLTPYGKALYQSVQQPLADIADSWRQMHIRFEDPTNLRLRIGVRREIVERLVRRIQFPGILQIETMPTRQAVAKLIDQQLDVAVSHFKPDAPTVIAKPFFAVSVKLVCPANWPVNSIAGMRQMIDRPVIAYRENPPFLGDWAAHFNRSLEDLNIRVFCEDWHAVIALIEAGYGYSLVPDDIQCPKGLKSIPINSKIVPKVNFYYLIAKHLNDLPVIKKLFAKS